MEMLGRRALWEVGLNYGHGTGHGIGNYFGVHECTSSTQYTHTVLKAELWLSMIHTACCGGSSICSACTCDVTISLKKLPILVHVMVRCKKMCLNVSHVIKKPWGTMRFSGKCKRKINFKQTHQNETKVLMSFFLTGKWHQIFHSALLKLKRMNGYPTFPSAL